MERAVVGVVLVGCCFGVEFGCVYLECLGGRRVRDLERAVGRGGRYGVVVLEHVVLG